MANPIAIRLLSHGSGRGPTTVPGGRGYTASAGSFVDLPINSADIQVLSANGWSAVGPVGTTAQRPTTLNAGEKYMDTTLNKLIVFDGVGFRDPSNGNSV